jgi:hypothetical protein
MCQKFNYDTQKRKQHKTEACDVGLHNYRYEYGFTRCSFKKRLQKTDEIVLSSDNNIWFCNWEVLVGLSNKTIGNI